MSLKKTCFIIMAIGDQLDAKGNIIVTKDKLREDYDLVIKEAILKADPGIEVVRADDVYNPGTMSTDIMMRIMKSDYVIADITYPNPNVFYELGLRHACKAGTIIIKNKDVKNNVPFDISHLRHLEYTSDIKGLNNLSEGIRNSFNCFNDKEFKTDNHFLETAKVIEFEYPLFRKEDVVNEEDVMFKLLQNKELIDLFFRQSNGDDVPQEELYKALMTDPEIAKLFIKGMVQKGGISFK